MSLAAKRDRRQISAQADESAQILALEAQLTALSNAFEAITNKYGVDYSFADLSDKIGANIDTMSEDLSKAEEIHAEIEDLISQQEDLIAIMEDAGLTPPEVDGYAVPD